MPDTRDGKPYFKGLNGLRGIAAMVVLVSHVDLSLVLFGLKPSGYHEGGMAGFAVMLFFVVSGFLITYLLLTERARCGRIDLKSFYIRRILRIWPVYYLVIVLAAVLLVADVVKWRGPLVPALAYYSLLAANVGYVIGLRPPVLAPLWSVGVEEQFYGVWPVILSRSRNVARSLVHVIAIYLALKVSLRFLEHGLVFDLVALTAFDSMAVGGLCAVAVMQRSSWLRLAFHPVVQVGAWVFLGWSILVRPVHLITLIDPEVHSIVYGVLVLNVSSNPRTLVSLEHPALDWLGRVSYGAYAFHMSVIGVLAFAAGGRLATFGSLTGARLVVLVTCVTMTLLVASVSYRYFESFFLKMKARFATSGVAQ